MSVNECVDINYTVCDVYLYASAFFKNTTVTNVSLQELFSLLAVQCNISQGPILRILLVDFHLFVSIRNNLFSFFLSIKFKIVLYYKFSEKYVGHCHGIARKFWYREDDYTV